MSDVANAGEGFTAKAISGYRCQVLKVCDLGSGMALAEDSQVIFLEYQSALELML